MFDRILVAIDDSESSEVALSFTTAMALQNNATVCVVHVNEYLVGGRGVAIKTQTEAIKFLESAVNGVRAAGIRTEGSLYLGDCFTVDTRITEAAKEWNADVIVLGSRRKQTRRFRRFAGQGMRERITGLSSLPVVTAPAPLDNVSSKVPSVVKEPAAARASYPCIRI